MHMKEALRHFEFELPIQSRLPCSPARSSLALRCPHSHASYVRVRRHVGPKLPDIAMLLFGSSRLMSALLASAHLPSPMHVRRFGAALGLSFTTMSSGIWPLPSCQRRTSCPLARSPTCEAACCAAFELELAGNDEPDSPISPRVGAEASELACLYV